jgi:hypothetical protein
MWAVIRGSIAPSERIFLRCGITTVATMLFLFFTGCFLIQFKCNDYITLRKGESNAKRLDTVFRPDEKDAATNEPIPAAPTPTGQAVAALVDIETQEANAASPQFQELGFASLALGMVALWVLGSGLAIDLARSALTPYGGMPDYPRVSFFRYGISLGALLSPAALSLGVAGLFQANRDQDTCWLGIITNGASLFTVTLVLW